MQLERLAHAVLFGEKFEDKLLFDVNFVDTPTMGALVTVPKFPGRPANLACVGKADFPKVDHLDQDSARGRILHFFANHELLAMELMALMLLKFPDAPKP